MTGFKAPIDALKLYFCEIKLWKYTLFLIIPATLFYIGVSYLIFWHMMPYLLNFLPEGTNSNIFLKYLYLGLYWISAVVLFAITMLCFYFTYTIIFILAATPFLDSLSLKVEKIKYNHTIDSEQLPEMLKSIHYSTVNAIKLTLLSTLWVLLLFPLNFIIPVIGCIPGFIIGGYFYGASFLVYSAEHRKIPYKVFMNNFKSKKSMITGFGLSLYLFLLIPLIGPIICLPIAVIAGTILFNDQFCENM